MKRNKIVFTVIKESDGSFSVIAQVGRSNQHLLAAQGDSWGELKTKALEAVNVYLTCKDKAPVTSDKVDYSFDLPSFFDAYPQLDATALSKQGGIRKGVLSQHAKGEKKAPDRQLHRILEAVKYSANELFK